MDFSSAFLPQFQKPQCFTITFFPTGFGLFSQIAAFISLGLGSELADITPRLRQTLKELSCVGHLHRGISAKGLALHGGPKIKPVSLLFSQ